MRTLTNKLIVANWKANKTITEAREWCETFSTLDHNAAYEYVICPPFPHLSALAEHFPNLQFGTQDFSPYGAGAYTGEVPGYILDGLHIRYTILGHSERRKYQGETSALVARKAAAALADGVTPIICVDRSEFQTQIDQLSRSEIESSIFAYEPVHAISTFGGHEDPLETTLAAIEELRELAGGRAPVLYGGSVDKENSLMYLQQEDINGVLVGKTSLDPRAFAQL